MPILSIIVPVFNVEPYLHECVESIRSQTFSDFELLLVDDGSNDGSGEICDYYAEMDHRIRVFHQSNRGVSTARNVALDEASGHYIAFVDSDDWIEPNMYQNMIDIAHKYGTDVVICGYMVCEETGTPKRRMLEHEEVLDQNELLESLYGMPIKTEGTVTNKLFVREIIADNRFRENLTMAEDWVFLFDCYTRCLSGYQTRECYYNTRDRKGSATRSNSVEAEYKWLLSSRIMLLSARSYSKQLERCAEDKFLDDCLRCLNRIKEIGQSTRQSYLRRVLMVRFLMAKELIRTYLYRILPKSKIHGYIYGLFR